MDIIFGGFLTVLSWIAVIFLSLNLYYPKPMLEHGVVTSSQIHEIYSDDGDYYCNYITINYNVSSCIYETCDYNLNTAITTSNEYYVGYTADLWIYDDKTCSFKQNKKQVRVYILIPLIIISVLFVLPTFMVLAYILTVIVSTFKYFLLKPKIILQPTTYSPIINPYSKDINNVDINNVDLTNLENDLKVIPL